MRTSRIVRLDSGMNVLLLGGTTEARQLAELLAHSELRLVCSLAGVTREQPDLPGQLRVGRFGGVSGLCTYLREHQIAAVVDATHPFAARMSANATQACAASGTPLLRLARPSWQAHPDQASWCWSDTMAEAKQAAEQLPGPVFLSIGRRELVRFADWHDRSVLARVVDPPETPVPASWTLVQARGPFSRAQEHQLMQKHQISALLTRDAGGQGAKLTAAKELGVTVIVVRRPPSLADVAQVTTPSQAMTWLENRSPNAHP